MQKKINAEIKQKDSAHIPYEIEKEIPQKVTTKRLNCELATVLIVGIKNLKKIKTQVSDDIIKKDLASIFNTFHHIIESHSLQKIKITGNTFMCAGGLPIGKTTNAVDVINAAIEIQHLIKDMRLNHDNIKQQPYEIKIGIHSGSVLFRKIGMKKNSYDIWGDTIKLTSSLKSKCNSNKINISEITYQLIKDEFDCEYRGKIEVKGSGKTSMYFVHGHKNKATNFDLIEKRILKMLENGLSKTLHYHGFPHTIDVINNVKLIAEKENITAEDVHLLKMAALFHDLGFLEAYTGHEAIGCKMAREMLPAYGVSNDDIEEICSMIMTTKVPQSPSTLLEKILCDADLLYLGTDNFIETGNTLYLELKENGKLKTEREWNELQVNFLKKHHFHTNYCKQNFVEIKEKNLNLIKEWLLNN